MLYYYNNSYYNIIGNVSKFSNIYTTNILEQAENNKYKILKKNIVYYIIQLLNLIY